MNEASVAYHPSSGFTLVIETNKAATPERDIVRLISRLSQLARFEEVSFGTAKRKTYETILAVTGVISAFANNLIINQNSTH